MRLTVIPSDNIIIKDGQRLVFQFAAPADLHAIQWYGTHGFVETTDGKQERIDSLNSVQAYIDAYAAEVARLAAIAETPKTLEQVRTEKLAELEAAYDTACQQPVAYMGTTFQADYGSQEILTKTLTSLNPAGGVPQGFAWWAMDNSAVPMTLAELNGLAMAMLAQGWAAFQHKQTKKAAARDAQTVEAVNAVTW